MNTETLLRAGANIIISPLSRQFVKETIEQTIRPTVSTPARILGIALIPIIGAYELSPFIAAATSLGKNGVNMETAAIFMAVLTAKVAVLTLGHAVDSKINKRELKKMLKDELSRPNSGLMSVLDDMGAQSYISTMLDINLPSLHSGWIDRLAPEQKEAVGKVLKTKPWRLLTCEKNTPGYRAMEANQKNRDQWAAGRAKELGVPLHEFQRSREVAKRFYKGLDEWRTVYNEDGTLKKT